MIKYIRPHWFISRYRDSTLTLWRVVMRQFIYTSFFFFFFFFFLTFFLGIKTLKLINRLRKWYIFKKYKVLLFYFEGVGASRVRLLPFEVEFQVPTSWSYFYTMPINSTLIPGHVSIEIHHARKQDYPI